MPLTEPYKKEIGLMESGARALCRAAYMMYQVLELIEVDLSAGDVPAKIRVELALSRARAALKLAREGRS